MHIQKSWRELRSVWKQRTPDEQKAILDSLSESEKRDINWWFVELARDKQLPPPGEWFCWLLLAGRGFGKTRTGAEFIVERARLGYKRIALIGQTKADVRDTMIEVEESSILNISLPWFMPDYQPSKRRVVWPNGATATIYSGDEPNQLRGPQHDTVWIDELAKFKYPKLTWDNMEFGLRMGTDPRVVVTTTPRPVPVIKERIADRQTVTVVGSTYENVDNLAPSFAARILERYEGTNLGRQEIHGQILEDQEGALWTRGIIDHVTSFPELTRIVVGVDPPGSHEGAECGIVAGGIAQVGGETHAYILADESRRGTPLQWSSAAVATYNQLHADRVVAENNFGGEMVERTIRTAPGGKDVAYRAVRASRGKYIRAEPVVALYERGLVHHVGEFPSLEDEQCTWVPGSRMPSPNRIDALVWLLFELMLKPQGWTWKG